MLIHCYLNKIILELFCINLKYTRPLSAFEFSIESLSVCTTSLSDVGDEHRPKLRLGQQPNSGGYVNAIYLNVSYNHKLAIGHLYFRDTPTPMTH